MAYIESDLERLAFGIKEIERFLSEKEPRVGDALYTCDVVLQSLDDTEEGKTALVAAEQRLLRGG